jgi:Tfp pilus assembly protein PilO
MNFLANPVNRVLLIVGVGILIAVFAYFMVIQPKLNQYADSQARLAQDQQSYQTLERVAEQKPLYLALTKQIQTRLSGVELTADPRAYIPSYLKQIEDLAKQDGLQVTAVTPQSTPQPSPSPGASAAPGAPNPQALSHIAPIASAERAAGSADLQAAQTNNVATATGATPIPGSATPVPGSGGASNGGAVPERNGAVPSNARANAIAYLNRSFTAVPINMELSGTYAQLKQFLRDLNKFPKLIGVGSIQITPASQALVGETPMLNVILPITAYQLSASEDNSTYTPSGTGVPSGAAGNGG